jgi:hypothetical protein
MRCCQLCSRPFPKKVVVDGKLRNLQNRRYCLVCSPFLAHNTRRLNESLTDDIRQRRAAEARQKKYRKYQRKARRERKRKLVQLLGGSCRICGYCKDSPRSYSFHHRDPATKAFSISERGLLRRWEELLAEVRKCVLLCSRCHDEVHDGLHPDKDAEWQGQVAQLVERGPEKAEVAGSSPALSTSLPAAPPGRC